MRADAARHDVLTASVDDVGRRMPRFQIGALPDGGDAFAVDEQGGIGQDSRLGAQSNQLRVDYQHGGDFPLPLPA